MKMYQVSTQVTKNLSNEMDLLRMLSFPGENYKITSRDKFDENSFHITININGDIAAYSRLSPGPNSVLHTWTGGKSSLPNDAETIDINRVLVNTKYQGMGLFKWILNETCIVAKRLGYSRINATCSPDIPDRLFIKNLLHYCGFIDCGSPLDEFESGGITVFVQPQVCNITEELFEGYFTKKIAMEEKLFKGFLNTKL